MLPQAALTQIMLGPGFGGEAIGRGPLAPPPSEWDSQPGRWEELIRDVWDACNTWQDGCESLYLQRGLPFGRQHFEMLGTRGQPIPSPVSFAGSVKTPSACPY